MKNTKERKPSKKTVEKMRKFVNDHYKVYGAIMSKLAHE